MIHHVARSDMEGYNPPTRHAELKTLYQILTIFHGTGDFGLRGETVPVFGHVTEDLYLGIFYRLAVSSPDIEIPTEQPVYRHRMNVALIGNGKLSLHGGFFNGGIDLGRIGRFH